MSHSLTRHALYLLFMDSIHYTYSLMHLLSAERSVRDRVDRARVCFQPVKNSASLNYINSNCYLAALERSQAIVPRQYITSVTDSLAGVRC